MNIVMMTNTYTPHTGGVARSVAWFSDAIRQRGDGVLVVAPSFEDMPDEEQDVIRLPAIQNFNGSDFSVRLPIPGLVRSAVNEFNPDVVHAHHPFLLGETALRVAALRNLPTVFTHHTMYEQYTHYVPGDSPKMQRFAIRLATEFANLCDHVVAPSQSIAEVLRDRGVTSPITPIPTGIDRLRFARGDAGAAKQKHGIPNDSIVVGHVGRLAPEKNLAFTARAVCLFLQGSPQRHFLLVGEGPSLEEIQKIVAEQGVKQQVHYSNGALDGQELVDAYHAMDVFAFASHSETQGMVLAEAMAAGTPVVAVDAPGAREVVSDGKNGRLLADDDEENFAAALAWCVEQADQQRDELARHVQETAEEFSMSSCVERLLKVYSDVASGSTKEYPRDESDWAATLRMLAEQWNIVTGVANAVGEALFNTESNAGDRVD